MHENDHPILFYPFLMAIYKQFFNVLICLLKHSCVQQNLEQYKILGKNSPYRVYNHVLSNLIPELNVLLVGLVSACCRSWGNVSGDMPEDAASVSGTLCTGPCTMYSRGWPGSAPLPPVTPAPPGGVSISSTWPWGRGTGVRCLVCK